MKLLLDTPIWLWALFEPERLSSAVRAALASGEHELWLSPISVRQALLLVERGRVRVGCFLAATAQVLGLTLVTTAARLIARTEYLVMANG